MSITKLLGKWTVLVWLAASVSFILAILAALEESEDISILGATLGVFTFVIFYTFLDYFLLKRNNTSLRKDLHLAVSIKIFTQFIPVIQFGSGSLAFLILEDMFLFEEALTETYFVTILDGCILTLFVGVLILLVKLFRAKIIPRVENLQQNETT